ncbi:ferredoxin [Micromonospora phaseoli]|uniref:Ferredoxin n=1 Tax=Micromonospora phaseoli TaxID=1144548 RepID=A0A1H7AU33_9ACTN|nr:ferredoxin [Micromonospora phaseoli]PZV96171.1 ferredoxin [Micromonospora phaseoli]GIJ79446.1 ferredoxin [Micromonospora phaseoli]SEJ69113.1 ferredoxin [Micromonospora phaseoli]
MTIRLTVEPDRCLGAGHCVRLVPEVFDEDDHGTVVLLVGEPDSDRLPAVREAAQLCPNRAISIQTTQQERER